MLFPNSLAQNFFEKQFNYSVENKTNGININTQIQTIQKKTYRF